MNKMIFINKINSTNANVMLKTTKIEIEEKNNS